jgi:putative aldouronate transport system permease protein
MKHPSTGRRVFVLANTVFASFLALICIVPIWTMFCYSISSSAAVSSKLVGFWPVDVTAAAYQRVMQNARFWKSLLVTGRRILLGLPLSMALIALAAYPLSKSETVFRARKFYVWVFIFAMLFSGGIIPSYILIIRLRLVDTIGALILPCAVPIFNVVLLMNFFRSIPAEIEDAALIDGAGQWMILWKIILPLSVPALATICLFVLLGHWNSWFDGLIYINNPDRYPLQSYLQTIIVDPAKVLQSFNLAEIRLWLKVNNETLRAAQIFISMIPVLCVYPFMQRYFTSGIIMGSVKG